VPEEQGANPLDWRKYQSGLDAVRVKVLTLSACSVAASLRFGRGWVTMSAVVGDVVDVPVAIVR
jgi:hypothetical protein